MMTLSMQKLPELLAAINGERELYLPVKTGRLLQMGRWTADAPYSLEGKTIDSAKRFFFPQSQDLVSFKTEGKNISINEHRDELAPFALFGVRACDARAMEVLDMVFLQEPHDSFYASRREAGLVITLGCNEPEETCFCGAFGVDMAAPAGDVAVWTVGDSLYWKPLTAKGEELTKKISGIFAEANGEQIKALEAHHSEVAGLLAEAPLASYDPKAVQGELKELFTSEKWAELSAACLGCGACTFVCPTCQCYDIQDYDTGHGVKRFRCWDSCMYSDFTLMAHGNPRTSQLERFRQRFMHKLVYFPENNDGAYSCVGCGRCVAKCPVSLNIARVIQAFGVNENVR